MAKQAAREPAEGLGSDEEEGQEKAAAAGAAPEAAAEEAAASEVAALPTAAELDALKEKADALQRQRQHDEAEQLYAK